MQTEQKSEIPIEEVKPSSAGDGVQMPEPANEPGAPTTAPVGLVEIEIERNKAVEKLNDGISITDDEAGAQCAIITALDDRIMKLTAFTQADIAVKVRLLREYGKDHAWGTSHYRLIAGILDALWFVGRDVHKAPADGHIGADLERLATSGGDVAATETKPPPLLPATPVTEEKKSQIQVMSLMVLDMEDDICLATHNGEMIGNLIDEIEIIKIGDGDPTINTSLREILQRFHDEFTIKICEINRRWEDITKLEFCRR